MNIKRKNITICHLSTTDSGGGASVAAYRIYSELIKKNIRGTFYCSKSTRDGETISVHKIFSKDISYFYRLLDFFLTKLFKKKGKATFSFNLFSEVHDSVIREINKHDLVVVYWVGSGFISPKILSKIKIPIIWRLSDMWPFTGGCHYSGECDLYKSTCNNCPQLGRFNNIVSAIQHSKAKHFSSVIVACPSKWILECAKNSYVFRQNKIRYIPTGIDEDIFKKRLDSSLNKYGLQDGVFTLCFGAVDSMGDPRKGGVYLLMLLKKIEALKDNIQVIIFGNLTEDFKNLNLTIKSVGVIKDSVELSYIYSACDMFVAPYLEDNLPNTVIEALACELPILAFNSGGIPELVVHQNNGYLAIREDIEDFYKGYHFIKQNKSMLAKNTRPHILKNHTLSLQVENYINLFNEVIKV